MTIIGLNKNSPNFDFALADPKHHPASKCKEYIKQYFVPLIDGTHGVFVNGKYTIMDQTTVTKTYFNRMGASKNEDGDDLFNISKWYFTQYKDLHTITYELNKDVISKGKLNLCPQMKHEYKPYKDFDEKTHKRVNYMLNYILEVLASGHKDQYEYILKWFAYMVKGYKNRAILYLRGGQGVGKSTLSLSLGQIGWEFLSDDFFLMDGQTAHSVYRRVRLWEDSTKSLGFEPLSEFMSPNERLKFIFEYSNLDGIVPISTLSVRVLAFPQLSNFTHLRSISPPKAFLEFTSATLSGLQSGSDESFSRLAKIVRNSSLYVFGVRGSTELIGDSLTNALDSVEGWQ